MRKGPRVRGKLIKKRSILYEVDQRVMIESINVKHLWIINNAVFLFWYLSDMTPEQQNKNMLNKFWTVQITLSYMHFVFHCPHKIFTAFSFLAIENVLTSLHSFLDLGNKTCPLLMVRYSHNFSISSNIYTVQTI